MEIGQGNVEQYIVLKANVLYGVVASGDIRRYRRGEINDFINTSPKVIIENDNEKEDAEYIFTKYSNIISIPVIDKDRILKYVYKRTYKDKYDVIKSAKVSNIHIIEDEILERVKYIDDRFGISKTWILSDLDLSETLSEKISDMIIKEDKIQNIKSDEIVLLVYRNDFNCKKIVDKLLKNRVKFITLPEYGPTDYFKTDEVAYRTLLSEAYRDGTKFDKSDFQNIFQAIAMTHDLEGDYVEIGVYKGDSGRAALLYMKNAGIIRNSYFLDTYEGFSYLDVKKTTDCYWMGSHTDTSIKYVNEQFKEFENYKLVKTNIITDEFPKEIKKIAVCNIDVDMNEAVEAALEKVKDKVVKGGIILAEDYGHTPSLIGAMVAVERFYKENKKAFYGLYMESGQFLMIKK